MRLIDKGAFLIAMIIVAASVFLRLNDSLSVPVEIIAHLLFRLLSMAYIATRQKNESVWFWSLLVFIFPVIGLIYYSFTLTVEEEKKEYQVEAGSVNDEEALDKLIEKLNRNKENN